MRRQQTPPMLFPPAPAHNGTKTSRAAADAVAARSPTLRALVLDAVLASGSAGCIHEQIAEATGIRLDTVKARVNELGWLGRVRALTERRSTSTGCKALVFVGEEFVLGRALEPWPRLRRDWHEVAVTQERRAIDAERRVQELERLLAARSTTQESAA